MNHKHVAVLIRNSRKLAGLTQIGLSRQLGFQNGQFISNIERGRASVPVKHVRKLSRLLKIRPEVIIQAKANDVMASMERAVGDGSAKKRVS